MKKTIFALLGILLLMPMAIAAYSPLNRDTGNHCGGGQSNNQPAPDLGMESGEEIVELDSIESETKLDVSLLNTKVYKQTSISEVVEMLKERINNILKSFWITNSKYEKNN